MKYFIKVRSRLKILITKIKLALYQYLSSIYDYFCLYFNIPIPESEEIQAIQKQTIIFIGEHLPTRIPRIAKWIKKTNADFYITLLCHEAGYVEKFISNDAEFDLVILFRNAWHLKRILNQFKKIDIFHAFAPKSYYPDIARQYKKPKTIYLQDMQDVYSIYYSDTKLRWLKKEMPHEKNCIINANGIISHSLEPNIALRNFKVNKKPSAIFFPLYCDNDVFITTPNAPLNINDIHIVYAGGVAGSHRNPKQYGYMQFHHIIKLLSDQKIHFHIYPSPSNLKADYEEYMHIEKNNAYFHFHEPVSQEKLTQELSIYHFGFLPFFKVQSEQSDDKLKYSTALKLFNYLEAGLPIIISKDIIYQSWIVDRYKTGILIDYDDIPNLHSIISENSYEDFRSHVFEARERLSIRKNINRLLQFYKSFKSA